MKFYAHPDYSYSYAIVNYTEGEVYTYFANSPRIALKNALKRFDHILRTAKLYGTDCKVSLVNANSGKVLLTEEYKVPEWIYIFGCKTEAEFEEKINELYDLVGE